MADTTETALTTDDWTALSRPLDRVLGTRSANALAKLGLNTVGDLLAHVPFRLARRGELMPIENVHEGDSVTVVGRVMDSYVRPMNNRRGFILSVDISDGEHDLSLTFFAKSSRPLKFHESKLSPGTIATFSGTISSYRGKLQLNHPEYELLDDESEVDPDEIAKPIPIYHAAQKVPSWQISKAIDVVLPTISNDDVPDPLPDSYRAQYGLPTKLDAIRSLHRPATEGEWYQAIERMKHEEAFVLQAILAQRAEAAQLVAAPACPPKSGGVLDAFDARLPYELTDGQRRVGEEISADISDTTPMRRLLQGDVGSGKTVVALRAMLQSIDAGHQAVLLAPTEVLATQHFETISGLLGDLGRGGQLDAAENAIRVELLTGSMSAPEKRSTLASMASGAANLVIGTHALLQDNVQLPFLGLVVVDEQHRFGVDQRDRLTEGAHMLVMTATPIPRTIAMTAFGDLEVSTLDELPQGRATITTNLVPSHKESWVQRAWERAREEADAGGRVYVVVPRISADVAEQGTDLSDDADVELNPGDNGMLPLEAEAPERPPLASVEATVAELRENPALAGVGIGVIHGRMSGEEKARAMADFASGRAPVLVATTVIEVGVDVPDATMMIIVDADRFGISQLHQLRGRIGRGTKPGLCLAIYSAPDGTVAAERLNAFASTTDGFTLAERDLELRSEGNVLGTQQSGRSSSLQFLKVTTDGEIIDAARTAARDLLAKDPTLTDHPALAAAIAHTDTEDTEYLERG